MFSTAHYSGLWARASWTPLFKNLRGKVNSPGNLPSWSHEERPSKVYLYLTVHRHP